MDGDTRTERGTAIQNLQDPHADGVVFSGWTEGLIAQKEARYACLAR